MISDEAVEAAHEARLAHKAVRSPGDAKKAMREALEAAEPHITRGAKAEAWEEGMEAMYDSTSHEWPPIHEANPYRSQA